MFLVYSSNIVKKPNVLFIKFSSVSIMCARSPMNIIICVINKDKSKIGPYQPNINELADTQQDNTVFTDEINRLKKDKKELQKQINNQKLESEKNNTELMKMLDKMQQLDKDKQQKITQQLEDIKKHEQIIKEFNKIKDLEARDKKQKITELIETKIEQEKQIQNLLIQIGTLNQDLQERQNKEEQYLQKIRELNENTQYIIKVIEKEPEYQQIIKTIQKSENPKSIIEEKVHDIVSPLFKGLPESQSKTITNLLTLGLSGFKNIFSILEDLEKILPNLDNIINKLLDNIPGLLASKTQLLELLKYVLPKEILQLLEDIILSMDFSNLYSALLLPYKISKAQAKVHQYFTTKFPNIYREVR